ncbi:MAG: entericidin A/B family lipoprotein [Phycisphaerales bacterium]|nr:entericidin A/B family lipoprotein [Phycisphaerales bacterium]
MKNRMKLVAAAVGAGLLVALSACNTVEGVGRDIERGGEKLQDAAR